MKLKQNIFNVLVRLEMRANADYDFLAIKLLQSGSKISEKTVDECIQHYLTYLHPKIDQDLVGYAKVLRHKHDDPNTIDYVNDVFRILKKVIRSFDSKLATSIFKDKHLEEKYHLGSGLKVSSKTIRWIEESCTIVKTKKMKETT